MEQVTKERLLELQQRRWERLKSFWRACDKHNYPLTTKHFFVGKEIELIRKGRKALAEVSNQD